MLSGIRVGEMLQSAALPPPEYSSCEVAAILLRRATLDQYRI